MKKYVFVFTIIAMLIFFTGCQSNKTDIKAGSIQPNAATVVDANELSIDEVKSFIQNSEKLFSHDFDYEYKLGYQNFYAVYKLKQDSNTNDLKNKLKKYYDKKILDYVIYTHEILDINGICGFNPDNMEGCYYVNVDGKFSIINQTKEVVEVKVPFKYKGVEDEEVEAYGTFTMTKQNNTLIITKISQEFNDSLYKDYKKNGLSFLPISYINAFQKMRGTWFSKDFIKDVSNADTLGIGTSAELSVNDDGNSSIHIVTTSDKTKGYVARIDSEICIKDEKSGEFSFEDDGFGHSGTGTVIINNDSIIINIKITKSTNKDSLWSIYEGELQPAK